MQDSPIKIRARLVSIHKWPFSAISASICGIACATYHLYASAQSLDFLDLAKNCSFLTGLLPGMPAFLAGWKEAIKDSELPYREAKASIGNLRQCPLIYKRFVDGH